MATLMRSLCMLFTSVFIFNVQAMYTSPAQVAQWAEQNKTALVTGSIVTVGAATAYYLESPKILAVSVVGAGVYVAYRSLSKDDEFQARLRVIDQQNSKIEGQYKRLNSGVDVLLEQQKRITTSAVQFSDSAKNAKENFSAVARVVDASLDVNFLQDAKELPIVVGKVEEQFANNVSMCNNINKSVVKVKENINALDTALESFVQAGQKSEEKLSRYMDERIACTVKLIDQGTADILKLLDKDHSLKAKLSDSY